VKRILFFSFVILTLFSCKQKTTADYLQDARISDSFKLYDKASFYFRKATELSPGDKNAWMKRGDYFLSRQKSDSATYCFSKAIDLDTLFAEAYYKRALSLKWNERELPIADLTKAILLKPDYGEAYKERARRLIQLKRDSLALADYTRSLAFIKDDYILYLERGKLALQKNDYQMALDDLTKGLGLAPKSYDLYYQRAMTNYALHNFEASKNDFTEAIKIYGDGYAYYGRARARFELGDIQGARQDKAEAISIDHYGEDQHDSIPYP
jgi:tetratricopeptide (TPR) repeat protein